ncbi:MAG: protein kinase [Acidobacteriota bacterium]
MIGESLGPYKIIERLGAGGMGEVYLGEDTRLGRKVAIKVLPQEFASDPERLARFEQEARAAAALNHPHIAAVFDVGTEGDTHFIVQEHLEGQSLRQRLEKGALIWKLLRSAFPPGMRANSHRPSSNASTFAYQTRSLTRWGSVMPPTRNT